jgi:3-oxoadipate enol-lactonase
MAFVDLQGSRFRYELDGPTDKPVLLLSNSLGTDLTMWEPQLHRLGRQFRVLRYDTRGHGESAVTPGPYSIEQLGRDVIALLDALKIERAYFCGISMGGATGLWLATHAPQRFLKMVLSNTAARFGTPEMWQTRIDTVRKGGTASVAQTSTERWFTAPFRARAPGIVERMRQTLLRFNSDGYIACCMAIRDVDQRESIGNIRLPTLVIAGTQDVATPPADGRFLAQRIPQARYLEIDAAHISNVEAPEIFSDAVLQFFNE